MTGPVLVVSATQGEVAPLEAALADVAPLTPREATRPATWWDRRQGRWGGLQVVLVTSGVGKANAAAATALAIDHVAPRCVLLLGIGGAYPGSGLGIGEVALAASETQVDSGVGHGPSWEGLDAVGFPLLATDPPSYNRLWFDQRFVSRVARELGVRAVPFGTSEALTADVERAEWLARRHGVAVESMEGGAVAQVALGFGVPLVQLRGVANAVGVRDKAHWNMKAAVANSCEVAKRALTLLEVA